MNELEIEIDINETEDININTLTPKQKALRLNSLIRLAKGSVFTTHDLEEALTLTRQLMKRQAMGMLISNIGFILTIFATVYLIALLIEGKLND